MPPQPTSRLSFSQLFLNHLKITVLPRSLLSLFCPRRQDLQEMSPLAIVDVFRNVPPPPPPQAPLPRITTLEFKLFVSNLVQ